MSRPVNLTKVRLQPRADVVEALTDALKRAKRGEVRGFVLACAADQGCDATSYVLGDGTIPVLVCAMERAKLRLLEHRE